MQTDIIKSPLARQLAREALEAAETAAQRWIDFLDLVRGDPDEEDCDAFGKHPDDEDGDLAEDDDPPDTGNGEDEAITGELAHYAIRLAGPGCSLSDPGGCEHDGLEPLLGAGATHIEAEAGRKRRGR